MTVHPQVQAMLDKMAAANLPAVHTLSPEAARLQMEETVKARGLDPTPVPRIWQREVPGPAGPIRVRLYRPEEGDRLLPLLVYFHGGGHVIGSIDTHDSVARNLCMGAHCMVASVDYRMAPEAKFPAAAEDSYAATAWLAAHAATIGADGSRVAVGGDSAGANLAAVVALIARDSGGPALALQLLVYPIADYACDTPSYARYAEGYGPLEAEGMYWFRDHYLNGPEDADDWRASPIKATRFDGLPPTHLVTAECDVLHDDGIAYAERLREAGNAVEHVNYPGMIHGFFSWAPMLDDSITAQARAAAALKQAFS